jgi:3-methyladenine DNA glycosylase AlkD
MEKEVLEMMAKNNEESLRFISKDMANLARMLKKTSFDNEEHFKANLVQASFYLTAYTVATKSFNRMVKEKENNPECDRVLVDYFLDEVVSMQAAELKKKEGGDDDR